MDVLDSAEEDIYNAITNAAAEVCQTPMASLTFIDANRQWFKSRVGLTARETARDISFCGHAINGPGLFLIPDAHSDTRFRHNPFVTGPPQVRFYAGMPLQSDGLALGTLCVLDTTPRTLSEEQIHSLSLLAESAMRVLNLRHRIGVSVFAKAVDMASDGVTISGASGNGMTIMYANESFLKATGYSYVETINQGPAFPLEQACPDARRACEEAAANGRMASLDCEYAHKSGATHWARSSFVPYVDNSGKLIYLVTVLRDITALREAEAQAQQAHAMRTTLASIAHVVNNFLNSAQLYSSVVKENLPCDPKMQHSFEAALEKTRRHLLTLNRMPAFRERKTSFGISLLDPDSEPK